MAKVKYTILVVACTFSIGVNCNILQILVNTCVIKIDTNSLKSEF